MNAFNHVLFVAATLVSCTLPTQAQLHTKPIVTQRPAWVAHRDLRGMWRDATVVAHVKIIDGEVRGTPTDPRFLPLVYTQFRAEVVRRFKGSVEAKKSLSFRQSAGALDLGDKVVVVEGREPLTPNAEYIVFLAARDNQYYLVDDIEGAFQLEKGFVTAKGFGRVAQMYHKADATRFTNELYQLMRETGL